MGWCRWPMTCYILASLGGPWIWKPQVESNLHLKAVWFLSSLGQNPTGKDHNVWGNLLFMINTGHCTFGMWGQVWTPQHWVRIFLTLLFTLSNVVLVCCLKIMSELGAKQVEGTSVEAPHLDAPKGDTSPTWWEEILRVTTPIDVGGLADNFFRVSMGNPQRETSESPIPGKSLEVNELDVGLWWCLYCLQLDMTMVWDPVKTNHLLSPHGQLLSSKIWYWQMPQILKIVSFSAWAWPSCSSVTIRSLERGFTCMRPRSLAEIMMKTTTWTGQPAHQQVFPITIAEGRWVISMSHAVSKHRDLQFPMETLWAIEREAHIMSSWTDEDEDGGTHPSSPPIIFLQRRRCAGGRHRVWTPMPHFPGLSHTLNPIPYPPQVNFPPPPLMTPILIGVPLLHIPCLLHPSQPHWYQHHQQPKPLPKQCRPMWLTSPYQHLHL